MSSSGTAAGYGQTVTLSRGQSSTSRLPPNHAQLTAGLDPLMAAYFWKYDANQTGQLDAHELQVAIKDLWGTAFDIGTYQRVRERCAALPPSPALPTRLVGSTSREVLSPVGPG